MTSPRVPPVAHVSPELAEVLSKTTVGNEQGDALRIFRTLAHRPILLRRFNALAGVFMAHGLLEPRLRELVILRVAAVSNCDYEWGQHVEIALRNGVSQEEIDQILTEAPLLGLNPAEAAAVAAVDLLISDCDLDDETWGRLELHFREPELVELISLIGFYRMAAGVLNSLRVQREEWLPPLPKDQNA